MDWVLGPVEEVMGKVSAIDGAEETWVG